jgi:hypothetical protein
MFARRAVTAEKIALKQNDRVDGDSGTVIHALTNLDTELLKNDDTPIRRTLGLCVSGGHLRRALRDCAAERRAAEARQDDPLRDAKNRGKRVATYQITSEPRRLPPPNGLCNLETGPETFQLIPTNDAQAAQLKSLTGKEISVKVDEVACAQDAGQMSEAIVTKWSVVTK